jgi:hypothetical protein
VVCAAIDDVEAVLAPVVGLPAVVVTLLIVVDVIPRT